MSKIVLITGASTGLGVGVAILAAKKGHRVYATMRNLKKREVLDAAAAKAGVTLTVLQLDVQDTASIQAAVDTIIDEHGRIDTLINNAGAGFVRTVEQASEADVQWIMDVNFLGVTRCTKAVLPHMRTARSGHVINISSVGGLVGQPFNEIYCAAKFAVEGLTESLAHYMKPNFGVHFTAIEPGGIHSEFSNNVLEHVQSSGGMLDDEYLPILQKYIAGVQQGLAGTDAYQSVEDVAQVIVECLENPDPPVRLRTSQWAESFTALKTGLDPDGRKQLAELSNQFAK